LAGDDGKRPLTLGTAGHIDHGKTALVAALTGVDTDRLPQEKARGISIELGYAPLELPSGRRLSVVDVPGHERFVRTMVAGASGIDLHLLVVACDDGVMPQTREHVSILRLLGLDRGVVALTKRDLVDDDTAAIVAEEVADLLPGVPAVEVSALRGDGLDRLRGLLDEAAEGVEGRTAEGPVRLPIDRVFTLRGIGTVVTGTLWSGSITPGDRLTIEPGGTRVRVRSVQVHDRPVGEAAAGQRVAVALVGAERREVARGSTLLSPGWLSESFRLECDLRVLADAPHPLRHAERVTVHHGTAEIQARVAVRGGAELPAGSAGRVQLRLAEPVVAARGDHVVVRLTAPRITIAGGTVVDPAPTRSGSAPAEPEAAPPPAPERPPPPGADALRARLRAEWLSPSPLNGEEVTAAGYLAGRGEAVRAGRQLAFAAEAYAAARDVAVEMIGESGSVAIAGLRDRLGISRRGAQALLEAMDAEGVTRRVGDERVLRRRSRDAEKL
jgi:selenocysteine-specific elongation factor